MDTHENVVRDVNELSPLCRDVVKRLNSAYQKNKQYYDLRKRPLKFRKGDIVWKKNQMLSGAQKSFTKKLAPKYTKTKVAEVTGTVTYRLTDLNGKNLGI